MSVPRPSVKIAESQPLYDRYTKRDLFERVALLPAELRQHILSYVIQACLDEAIKSWPNALTYQVRMSKITLILGTLITTTILPRLYHDIVYAVKCHIKLHTDQVEKIDSDLRQLEVQIEAQTRALFADADAAHVAFLAGYQVLGQLEDIHHHGRKLMERHRKTAEQLGEMLDSDLAEVAPMVGLEGLSG